MQVDFDTVRMMRPDVPSGIFPHFGKNARPSAA